MDGISANDSSALKNSASGLAAPHYIAAENSPRLLLVDDEPRLLSSLCAMLGDRGFQMLTASSGSETIELLGKLQFDLVLLDLRLPDIGGHEIMDFINAKGIDATVIVLSGDTGIEAAIGALKRGAYDYLRKPYSREELLKTIDNALQQRKLENENRSIAMRLESSEKLYRYLVDSSPDIIYTLDQEGRFTFVNDRVKQLLGYGSQELVGRHYSVLVHDDDIERARYVFNERRVGERASRNVELRLKSLSGEDQERTFDNTLMTISFNSMGMYSLGKEIVNRKFFGTYGVARDITDRKRAEELISYQAYHDILTDLPNRILFKDRLGLAVIQARRNRAELAVMFVDLDRFKLVNDTLGHVKGDELLQHVSGRLKNCLRRGDTLARIGGDEFTAVLPELRDRQDAEIIAEKFLESLRQPFFLDGKEVYISASIGIAVYPSDGDSIDELLRHADIAMYYVKSQGKNAHAFYESSMLDASYQKVALEQSLRRALEQNELEMYYQPQVDVLTGEIVGAEGLMRWNHPERGLLTAGEFLPFAEENGLMVPISDWMLGALCRDLLQWNAVGGESVRLSLNISPHYLDHGDFFDKIRDALSRFNISPSQIEVEITENVCIRNPQYAIEQLNRLCQLGVSIAIDDFGTGYSSLSYLHRFPVHTIKIDQSFVKEIQRENGHFPVVMAIISIAHGLGLNLVAEGVETKTQAQYLEQSGCKIMQGYFYYQPLSRLQFLELLREKRAISA
ncbi:EAL domain-containing protein [Propionivibrio sp.]|uniref:EAL domain-containing response regulator n=1 Tax=Propionivibrio sp. TaxID=2212460 RepID=UPI0025FC15DB|nr:EAL domain-containing protein [Propionivibrio sp.]MBK7356864.1 EAL domain-containing protein [Propionivibrio sp.]MBK8401705.1 EAL domain-containing protein [Propionivibrio sp.]MBK8745023.1 EAL domain-containing protein [Propionivibrio sp.]MBK8893885.1 EAL domain-containing protein [Propionivibrio sp.]MBL0208208.1 EAL domain-containing protein [Propionivibrio sp.]